MEQLVCSFAALREFVRERGRRDLSFSSPRAASDSRAQDELVVRIALAALSSRAAEDPICERDCGQVSWPRARTPPIELCRASHASSDVQCSIANAWDAERVLVVRSEILVRVAAPVTRALALKSLIRTSLGCAFFLPQLSPFYLRTVYIRISNNSSARCYIFLSFHTGRPAIAAAPRDCSF